MGFLSLTGSAGEYMRGACWCMLALGVACTPLDVVIHREEERDQTSMTGNETDNSTAMPGTDTGTTELGSGGGASDTGEENGGSGSLDVVHLLDDFEDGDTKAFDPGGWWYTINDGTGQQTLEIVSTTDEGVPSQVEPGSCFATHSDSFAEWGSAWGVDVAEYEFAGDELEVSFLLAASRPVQVELHAIDGSGKHFTRALQATASWTRMSIRLDSLAIVEGQAVQRLEVATTEELQWFVFEFEPVTIWLDDVVLRSSSN